MKSTIMLVDTEFIDLATPFVYDLSYTIATLENGVFEPLKIVGRVIKQVYDNKMLFATAYYSNKKPLYTSALRRKVYKKDFFGRVMNTMKNDIEKYGVECVMGYNVSADTRAIEFTAKHLGTSNALENVEIIDLMPIVQKAICDTMEYRQYAKDNGLITEKGYLKTGVESVAKFVYKNEKFVEKHLGVSDNHHELELLNVSMRNGAKIENLPKQFFKNE